MRRRTEEEEEEAEEEEEEEDAEEEDEEHAEEDEEEEEELDEEEEAGPFTMQQPFPSDEPPRNILSAGKTLEHTARMRWQYLSEGDATFCNAHPVPPELTFGSLCTGSGFDHWICAASQVAMEAQGHHVSFKCLFACDKSRRSNCGCIVCSHRTLASLPIARLWHLVIPRAGSMAAKPTRPSPRERRHLSANVKCRP